MALNSSNFYVTLPSNACMNYYPDNKQSNFKIELPETLYLGEDYEVALAEIQYPFSWRTFANKGSFTIKIVNTNITDSKVQIQQIFFPAVYYRSMRDLCLTISRKLETFFEIEKSNAFAEFKVDGIEQKINFNISPHILVKFENEACDVLGLEHDEWITGRQYATYRHNLSRGFHALYVYCSICKDQIVGGDYVPLLRTVGIKGKAGENVIQIYNEPHYVAVKSMPIKTIEIDIKDDTALNVPFVYGKVVCKLHFRRIKQ